MISGPGDEAQVASSLHFAESAKVGPQVVARFFYCLKPVCAVSRRRKSSKGSKGSRGPSKPLTNELQEKFLKWAAEACDVHGLDLYEAEAAARGKWILRVFADRVGAETGAGISVKECVDVSRYLEAILDADEDVPEHYVLEVSSPGIERKIKTLEHVEKSLGQDVALTLREPRDGKDKVIGRLKAHSEGLLTLEVSGEEMEIPWDEVAKARWTFDFS